jgi:hypothetical protein
MLLEKVRETVKRHKADGFVWGNSGNPLCLPTPEQKYPTLSELVAALDGDMIENYIIYNGLPLTAWQGDGKTSWDQLGRNLQPYLEQGHPILAHSYLEENPTDPSQPREYAFLCYASARIAGLTWFGGCNNSLTNVFADLFHLALGRPVTGELVDAASGIDYRVFEAGLVAVNWDQNSTKALTMQSPSVTATYFCDLFNNVTGVPLGGPAPAAGFQIPPVSGRVYLFGAADSDYGLNTLI